ncbi:transglycosylase domain-containing protein [Anaerovorax odorimutans]|uniref:transglycosylase domain-containing protein n=1 Tax=Anaerovorax odorimutans TaxID=109327 RepID=UPI00041E96C1|nr:transglycosylase domain-containing protein [Anaerovorax odorimutans]
MTDKFNNDEKEKKQINDYFAEFDKISNEFDKSKEESIDDLDDYLELKDEVNKNLNQAENPTAKVQKTRVERLCESKKETPLAKLKYKINEVKNKFSTQNNSEDSHNTEVHMSTKKKKKHTLNKKKFTKFILAVTLTVFIVLLGIVGSIIVTAPTINPNDIYSVLTENSVLYDDSGQVMDSLLTSDGLRTNVSYSDLPPDLVNAFVAIEDKTFWEHHGFNFVRILGAIKERIFEGGKISGTSTITQQLARNLYLVETKSKYDMTRKIREAYYAILLEKQLSKEQIVEAYLNTIYLGYGANGVQAASQAYFSKDVSELTLEECAALATLPKAPDTYAFIKKYDKSTIEENNPNIVYRGDNLTYVYNDSFSDRKDLVLEFMLEQGKITQSQYDTAIKYDLRNSIDPNEDTIKEASSYFVDYVIEEVVNDLMETQKLSESDAKFRVYNGGLRIYTTMNSKMQDIMETEFSNNSNFPRAVNLNKDSANNIIDSNGKVLLYSYDNYFDNNGNFTLKPDEYEFKNDGSLILYKGKRLNLYKTKVQDGIDYSIQFKNMYTIENSTLYSIQGGVIPIPQEYKDRDSDGNFIISKKFFQKEPNFLQINSNSITVTPEHYTLEQKIIQPQSAMVIYDFKNGGIKAMVGGRNINGRLILNRATDTPRQPGSSMKPIGAYGAALQSSVDELNGNSSAVKNKDELYGNYWTAASVINDSKMTYNGKVWPKNWYNGYRGLTRMRTAIEQSVNTCAVKVVNDIGVSKSVKFAKKLGISTIVESGSVNDMNSAAMALGGMTKGVTPLEMVAAYGTFANQGMYTTPISYTKVTNKMDEVILENTSTKTQVMDKGVAFIMTDMMRTAVTAGIAGNASIGTQPVAGKTGTTTDNYDAWFVGYTPQYAAAVWIGNDINIELSQGSTAATKVFAKVMKQVHSGLPTSSFVKPNNVISVAIDADSGMLPNGGNTINEYFIKGTEPTKKDNIHTTVKICEDSGFLATPYCPHCIEKTFVNKASSSSDSAPTTYCNLHNPDITKYPISPDATLNTDFDPNKNTTESGIQENSNNNDNNKNDNNNVNKDDKDKDIDDGSKPPSWLDFSN